MPARPASDLTVASIPAHAARVLPDKCALDDGHRQLSYRALDTAVNALASALRHAGVATGDVVCAFLPNCIDYVIVVLAVARAGAVFSPINPRFKSLEVAALLRAARPVVIFTTAERVALVREAAARAPWISAQLVAIDATPAVAADVQSIEDWLTTAAGALPAVSEDDCFSLMFTSGTTGVPKGAMATHRARMLWVLNAAIQYSLSDEDRYLGTMPQVHSAGLTFTLMHLYVGATVRILEPFDPLAFLEIVERERVSSALTVPTMLTMILEAFDRAPHRPETDSLKRLVTCGSPLPLRTKRDVIARITDQLYDYYGSTESNSMTVLKPRDQLRKPASVGQPFTNVELMIADTSGRPLPAGEAGEVWCRNPSVMIRYRDRPDDTSAAFVGRWYRTRDMGYLDDEGYLFLVGRWGDMIISGGVNMYPAEIEQVIMLHPAVRDCSVVPLPDPKWGEVVKAFVVLRPGQVMDLAMLQQHCTAHLADYKKPRSLEVVGEIPRNAGGKTIKALLRAPATQST